MEACLVPAMVVETGFSEPLVSGCSAEERKEGAATKGGLPEGQGERDRFCAVLDLYQQALEDLRTFALKKSFNKHFDGDQLYSRLEAKIASPDFLERLGGIHEAVPAVAPPETQDDQGSWDVISEIDLINTDLKDSRNCMEPESYVFVNQEDIIEGMACFMAKYVSSLPQAKDMSPKQLQTALKKALGAPKKGRLRKLWSSSKVLYTAASWGATAVSLYNNPVVVQAASNAFWTSIQLVTKYV